MFDVIIVGAGPAGLTAALYAGRYCLKTVVFEKMMPGGQIILSPTIENYPGFPEGIKTEDLIANFVKQIEPLGVKIESEEILSIEKNSNNFFVVNTADNKYETKAVIIASGAKWKKLAVPGEEKLTGRGVSYCGTCDAPLFKNKEIIVVGGGDKAIEEAIYLSSYASKVTIIHRRQEFRAANIILEKAKKNQKINFVLDSIVEEIVGDKKVESVKVKNVKTGSNILINCQGVFIFVGIEANTGFIKNYLKLDSQGFIITDDQMQTSESGIWACGDCRSKVLYQVINGCGEGAVAAHGVHSYLLKK